MASTASFGDANRSLQVGQSFAPIKAEFHLPPGKLPIFKLVHDWLHDGKGALSESSDRLFHGMHSFMSIMANVSGHAK